MIMQIKPCKWSEVLCQRWTLALSCLCTAGIEGSCMLIDGHQITKQSYLAAVHLSSFCFVTMTVMCRKRASQLSSTFSLTL